MKEDALEALYEKRLKKKLLQREQEEDSKLQVDHVEALPIKTLDGQLKYRTGTLLPISPFQSVSFHSFSLGGVVYM